MEKNRDRILWGLMVIIMGVPLFVVAIFKHLNSLIKSGSLDYYILGDSDVSTKSNKIDTDILLKILPLVFVIIVFLISLVLTIKYWSKVKRVSKWVIFKLTTSDTL